MTEIFEKKRENGVDEKRKRTFSWNFLGFIEIFCNGIPKL